MWTRYATQTCTPDLQTLDRSATHTCEPGLGQEFAPTPRALFRDGRGFQEDATTSASRRQRAAMMGQLNWLRPEEMRWPVAQGELGLAEAVRSGLGGMVRHTHIQQYAP